MSDKPCGGLPGGAHPRAQLAATTALPYAAAARKAGASCPAGPGREPQAAARPPAPPDALAALAAGSQPIGGRATIDRPGEPSGLPPPDCKAGHWREPGGRGPSWRRRATDWPQVPPPRGPSPTSFPPAQLPWPCVGAPAAAHVPHAQGIPRSPRALITVPDVPPARPIVTADARRHGHPRHRRLSAATRAVAALLNGWPCYSVLHRVIPHSDMNV